jgi:hypothetical protein
LNGGSRETVGFSPPGTVAAMACPVRAVALDSFERSPAGVDQPARARTNRRAVSESWRGIGTSQRVRASRPHGRAGNRRATAQRASHALPTIERCSRTAQISPYFRHFRCLYHVIMHHGPGWHRRPRREGPIVRNTSFHQRSSEPTPYRPARPGGSIPLGRGRSRPAVTMLFDPVCPPNTLPRSFRDRFGSVTGSIFC